MRHLAALRLAAQNSVGRRANASAESDGGVVPIARLKPSRYDGIGPIARLKPARSGGIGPIARLKPARYGGIGPIARLNLVRYGVLAMARAAAIALAAILAGACGNSR